MCPDDSLLEDHSGVFLFETMIFLATSGHIATAHYKCIYIHKCLFLCIVRRFKAFMQQFCFLLPTYQRNVVFHIYFIQKGFLCLHSQFLFDVLYD